MNCRRDAGETPVILSTGLASVVGPDGNVGLRGGFRSGIPVSPGSVFSAEYVVRTVNVPDLSAGKIKPAELANSFVGYGTHRAGQIQAADYRVSGQAQISNRQFVEDCGGQPT